jgi:hypothetical protein
MTRMGGTSKAQVIRWVSMVLRKRMGASRGKQTRLGDAERAGGCTFRQPSSAVFVVPTGDTSAITHLTIP